MPRTGEVVPIRAGSEAPHGESADLARMALPRGGTAPTQQQANPTAGPAQAAPIPGGVVPPTAPDLNDGFDPALLGPTHRPDEPVTHGAPFGPGANFTQASYEDDRTFALRVADTLATDPKLSAFVDALRTGR